MRPIDLHPGQHPSCGNCGMGYNPADRYCRYCGAPNGDPVYIDDDFACIYGPCPMVRVHTCRSCGHRWETELMVDRERYCPKCGGRAPYIEADRERDPDLASIFQGRPGAGAPKEEAPGSSRRDAEDRKVSEDTLRLSDLLDKLKF